MNRPLRFFSLSSLVVAVACGGRVEDVPSAPGAPAPGSASGSTPGSATPPEDPQVPAAPLPAPVGAVADTATPPLAMLPATSRTRAERCGARLGDGVVGEGGTAIWEASGSGSRRVASGALPGDHHLNRVLGAVGEDVFLETWSGTLDQRYGIVRVASEDGAASEVAPLGVGTVRSAVRWRGALWGVRGTTLVRITTAGVTVVADDVAPSARVVLRTSGVVVADATGVRRVRQDGTLVSAAVPIEGAPYGEAWDVHPDGTVVHAAGKELRRSDRATPLAVAAEPITSARIDLGTGAVAFAVRRVAPALTSLFVVDDAGVRHVLATDRHLTQGTETPFAIVAAELGRLTVATTCSDDEDAPSVMPVHVDAATGAVSYVVDEPAYPYVRDVGRLLDAELLRDADTWLDSAAPRFFLRR